MNRINIAIAVTAAAVLFVAGYAQTGKGSGQATSPQAAIGRYQLMTGEYGYNAGALVSQMKGVFRIDTATGRTSLYQVGTDNQGRYVEYWHQIDESLRPPQ
jgi:hypothetical protein